MVYRLLQRTTLMFWRSPTLRRFALHQVRRIIMAVLVDRMVNQRNQSDSNSDRIVVPIVIEE